MKEFFGFGGYQREPEGFLSWQHLLFVSSLMVAMTVLAIVFGLKNKNKTPEKKNTVLIVNAVLINTIELCKIIAVCLRSDDSMHWAYHLPLFLCSIQLITIPLAAFSKGRIKEASLDFVFIFGVLGALLGTFGAGQNYACYPVLSIDNVASGLTHSISGFCSLYIAISGMLSMKRKNISITYAIVGVFCGIAYIVNKLIDYNYMFLMRGDGTPYDLVYRFVDGSPVLYPLCVFALFLVYITVFYLVYFLVRKMVAQKTELSCPIDSSLEIPSEQVVR